MLSKIEWNGKPVASVKTGFASAVRIAGLDVANGNVTPHTLRHTGATWLMQRGAPMWEAAGFLGMSEKTFATLTAIIILPICGALKSKEDRGLTNR